VTSTRVELAQRQIEEQEQQRLFGVLPNFFVSSGILGSLASGGLSNLYYPAEDRKGVRLTFENAAIGLGGAALGHLAQEFLFKKLTSHSRESTTP
jgi:hypothetical protein